QLSNEFCYSVIYTRIPVDHYGLNLLPGARLLIEIMEEVCEKLEAEVMTILIGPGSPIKESELAARVRDFLGTFSSGGTAVALEFRGMRPSGEVFDFMKESGAIHSVDLSNSEPRYEGRVLYSWVFGKGEENIYEFDDRELKEIAKKASAPKFEKSILAFHGVRMYRDAGRVKSFIEKGYFPKITSGVGTESIREVLSADARFPTEKSRLLK